MNSRYKPAAVGIAVFFLVLAWQALTVHFNSDGNWTALFYIGDRWPLPPELASDDVRILRNDAGYDGVFYHLAAHDPWLRRGFSRYADNPSLRWRRILTPALAHTAALGIDARIHAAYVSINLLFVFLGAWWLARFAASHRLSPGWGFGFLAVPSVLVSMDRLTIDTALAALTIGFALYALEHKDSGAMALLTLCPLARETGLCVTVGQALLMLKERRSVKLLYVCATALPFFAWAGYVRLNTPRDGTTWLSWPFAGIVRRTLDPFIYPLTGRWVAVAGVLDYLALMGIWVALFLAGYLAWKRKSGLLEVCAYSFAFFAIWLGKADIWWGAYEFGRTLSPLLILLGLISLRDGTRWFLMPLACVLPRILLQLEPQVLGILKG